MVLTNAEGKLQLLDPATSELVYKDYSHVNKLGGKFVEQVFRKELFDQKICEVGTVFQHTK